MGFVVGKIISAVFGLLIEIMVGALTLGAAAPHLFNSLGGLNWRLVIGAGSGSAMIGTFMALGTHLGPNRNPSPAFDPKAALTAFI